MSGTINEIPNSMTNPIPIPMNQNQMLPTMNTLPNTQPVYSPYSTHYNTYPNYHPSYSILRKNRIEFPRFNDKGF